MATYWSPGAWLREFEALGPDQKVRAEAHATRLVGVGWREDTARKLGYLMVEDEERRRTAATRDGQTDDTDPEG